MIAFQVLDIWSKFHRKVVVSCYTQTHACSNKSGETEHFIRGAETSWKLEARPTARAMSHLTYIA